MLMMRNGAAGPVRRYRPEMRGGLKLAYDIGKESRPRGGRLRKGLKGEQQHVSSKERSI